LAAILGISIGCWTRWDFSDVRWSPLDGQQIPKPNSKAQFEFWSDSGVFEIEVELPMATSDISQTGGLVDKPPVPCKIGFLLRHGDRVLTNIDTTSLRWTGTVGYAHMNCFSGGAINIPKLGKYVLEIANGDVDLKFSSAAVSLERQGNAENAAFLSGICKVLSFTLLGSSVMVAMVSWIRSLLNRGKPTAGDKTVTV